MNNIAEWIPIYKETNLAHIPVDPMSTLTNILFLAIVIFWTLKIWKHLKQHRFIGFALPFLFIGWFGGTLYHGIRGHPIWLFLDVLPIGILCFAAMIHFWRRINAKWYYAALTIIIPLIVLSLFKTNSGSLRAAVAYASFSLPILLPLFLNIKKNNYKNWIVPFSALLSFLIAMFFRYVDLNVSFRYGTHWLWHTFGAIAVHIMFMYVYLDDLDKKSKNKL